MRAAEFMRALADVIDAMDGVDSAEPENKTPMEEPGVFVPPLQQKIELMKKMADVPSSKNKANFNTSAAEEDEPFEG